MENEFLKTIPRIGLTSQQVSERIKAGKVNTSRTKTSKTYAQIIAGNLFTWFNLICFVLAIALVSVGNFSNIMFIFVFLANLFIGIVQEVKAKKMVDKITVIYETKIQVLREREIVFVPTNQVVQDDIVFFKTGNQICADCEIVDGSVEVNESMLTGESNPIKKLVGDKILGGSYVISGSCTAQAQKVGLETYSSTLVKKARKLKGNKSDILKTLNLIIKTIGIVLIPLGILTFIDTYSSNNLVDAITKTAGSMIGMMPVGMFLLTSVSLVVGVLNLAKKKTLVQDLYCIEMLARANVLCLDKTGTLTDGTMTVKNVLPINTSLEEVEKIMASYTSSVLTENSTNDALSKRFLTNNLNTKYNPTSILEFSSERKFSAITFETLGTFMLGAPEFVTKNLSKEQLQTISNLTQEGLRVIVLCKSSEKVSSEKISKNNTPIAIISIADNIRKDAKETIRWFNQNGVEIKVISGDNPQTVSSICKQVGIKHAKKFVSLENMSDDEVKKCATKYNIFGRVTPEQKSIIIKTLRKSGKKVAMTGDGVNDILAFKESDCSIAMASGSEATRSASDIIMLENNFSSMPNIVMEGRRVINNVSKASSLFLTKTFFAMFLTIFVLISKNFSYPLDPNQIFLWETFFIGIPAFLLALQPNSEKVNGAFIADLSSKALPGALVLFLSTLACYVYCWKTSQMEILSTLISYTITLGASVILFHICLPLNLYRAGVVFGMIGLCMLSLILAPKTLFNYTYLHSQEFLFMLVSILAISILYPLLKLLFEKFFHIEKKQEDI